MKVPCPLIFSLIHQLARASKPPDYDPAVLNGKHGEYPVQNYFSSKLQAPVVSFLEWSPDCEDGKHVFFAPRGWKVPHPGPMILDDQGSLVWSEHFQNDFGGQAYDFKVQSYQGEDVLTFWLGDDRVRGHGAGHFYMLNSSYDTVRKIGATNSLFADLHDLVITPEGTAMLIIFQPTKADVRPAGRSFNDVWNQAIWDCVFQEFDIETEQLLFEWRASEHLQLNSTYSYLDPWADVGTQLSPFDWVHLNSIEKDDIGNYLISSRNLHAILYIDGQTKDIIWSLGGKSNLFQDQSNGHALNFAWQHDARFVSPNLFKDLYEPPPFTEGWTTRLMTVFDNAALDWDYSYGPIQSRAILLEITYPKPGNGIRSAFQTNPTLGTIKSSSSLHSHLAIPVSDKDRAKIDAINGSDPRYVVRVISQYTHPSDIISSSQGSVQLLPQGPGKDAHLLVGFGINPVLTEFSSAGAALCDMHFGPTSSWETGDVLSYRAYKQRWVGRPRRPPAAVVRRNSVHASWNGATEVRMWQLQGSASDAGDGDGNTDDWADLARVPKTGFETTIPLDESAPAYKRLRVVALDANGAACEHGVSADIVRRSALASIVPRPADLQLTALDLAVWLSGAVLALLIVRYVWDRMRAGKAQSKQGRPLLPRTRVD